MEILLQEHRALGAYVILDRFRDEGLGSQTPVAYRALDFLVTNGLAAAPLGCFVVRHRMACFGDATAHAAILGAALSLSISISVFAEAMVIALLMALTVNLLTGRGYAMDTLLGVLAHSALVFGLVAVSFISGTRIDLMAYLFGDILDLSRLDLTVI
jgi:zinc transport system permease protein